MGSSESKDRTQSDSKLNFQENDQFSNANAEYLLKNCVVLKRISDLRYGDIKIIKDNQSNETCILKELVANTKEAFERDLKFVANRRLVSHPNIVGLIGYTKEDKHEFCSSFFKINLFIEFYEKDLDIELNQRINEGTYYSEGDLLFMMENLVSALHFLQTQNISHGDVRHLNIFCSKKNSFKITDPAITLQRPSAIIQSLTGNTQGYLSPEALYAIAKEDLNPKINGYKSDVFSLGITILSCATLTRGEDIYDYNNLKINQDLLIERLTIVRKKYPGLFYDTLSKMLVFKEEERLDFIGLMNILNPYQDMIRNYCKITILVKNEAKKSNVESEPQEMRASFTKHESPLQIEPIGEFDIAAYSYQDRIQPVIRQSVMSEINRLNVHSYTPEKTRSSVINSKQKDRTERISADKMHSEISLAKSTFAPRDGFPTTKQFNAEPHITSEGSPNAKLMLTTHNEESPEQAATPYIGHRDHLNASNYRPSKDQEVKIVSITEHQPKTQEIYLQPVENSQFSNQSGIPYSVVDFAKYKSNDQNVNRIQSNPTETLYSSAGINPAYQQISLIQAQPQTTLPNYQSQYQPQYRIVSQSQIPSSEPAQSNLINVTNYSQIHDGQPIAYVVPQSYQSPTLVSNSNLGYEHGKMSAIHHNYYPQKEVEVDINTGNIPNQNQNFIMTNHDQRVKEAIQRSQKTSEVISPSSNSPITNVILTNNPNNTIITNSTLLQWKKEDSNNTPFIEYKSPSIQPETTIQSPQPIQSSVLQTIPSVIQQNDWRSQSGSPYMTAYNQPILQQYQSNSIIKSEWTD